MPMRANPPIRERVATLSPLPSHPQETRASSLSDGALGVSGNLEAQGSDDDAATAVRAR